ncbi:MAG: glycoside hydrolase family 5 protein [Planctomycetes bacterium]|nr:glycoside hydrolase family 5 protein [Planctomycetota bacterium]
MKRSSLLRTLSAFALCLLASTLLAPSCNPPQGTGPTPPAPPSRYRPLRAEGRWLRDAQGRAVFLRGYNYSHLSKTPPFTSWIAEEHFDRLVSMGANCVRLLVIWEALEPAEGTYDESYLRKMEEVVGWCEKRGIWVILDMHQDLWARPFGGDGAPKWATKDDLVDPNVLLEPWGLTYFTEEVRANFDRFWNVDAFQAKFRRAWATVVRRLGKSPTVIGYDLFNEPSPGTARPDRFEPDLLKPFYEKLIAEIRAIDPDRIVFVEPGIQASTGLPSFLPPMKEKNLAYAPHFYEPSVQFGMPYPGQWPSAVSYARMVAEASVLEMPLVLGEWGTWLDIPDSVPYIRDQLELQESLLVPGALLWNFDPDPDSSPTLEKDRFDPFNKDGSERPALALLDRPYPERVPGEPVAFGFDTTTRVFRLEWETPATGTPGAPSTIHLPARHYPNGFTVASSDRNGTWRWTFDPARRTLSVWADPTAARHAIRVTPK